MNSMLTEDEIEKLLKPRTDQLAQVQPQRQLAYLASLLEYSIGIQLRISQLLIRLNENSKYVDSASSERVSPGDVSELGGQIQEIMEILRNISDEMSRVEDNTRQIERNTGR